MGPRPGRAPARPPRPAPPTARGIAVAVLAAAEAGERANVVLPRSLAASALGDKDRRFATELTYGTLRMCRACDWLAGRFARGELEPGARAAVRAGTYQLAFMRVPPYAAVSATVSEAPRRARGTVNAVLRRVADLVAAAPLEWPDLGTRLSYPDWVIQRLGQDLGPGRALEALEMMNEAPTVSVRADGYTQDPGSQAVGAHFTRWLEGRQGPVADLCAAPGGKATYMAGQRPFVVAADIDARRALDVQANARGLVLPNLAVVVADAGSPPLRVGSFAGVLVDAPCSGLGALRRRPDARWRVRPGDVGRLARLQRRLLAAAAALVAPGGVLAYSVCTLTRAETDDVAEWLAGHLSGPGAGGPWTALAPPGPPWEPSGPGAVLLPQAAGTDGMYLAAFARAERG